MQKIFIWLGIISLCLIFLSKYNQTAIPSNNQRSALTKIHQKNQTAKIKVRTMNSDWLRKPIWIPRNHNFDVITPASKISFRYSGTIGDLYKARKITVGQEYLDLGRIHGGVWLDFKLPRKEKSEVIRVYISKS